MDLRNVLENLWNPLFLEIMLNHEYVSRNLYLPSLFFTSAHKSIKLSCLKNDTISRVDRPYFMEMTHKFPKMQGCRR